MNTIRWWVDASFGTHWDSKGHIGAMMSFGKGAAMSLSKKQKLNVRSSTKSKLIGIDDAIPSIMWLMYFIKAQGYDVTHNILYQDNKSTILIATNGRMSSSKQTKHIHHRYFLVGCSRDATHRNVDGLNCYLRLILVQITIRMQELYCLNI